MPTGDAVYMSQALALASLAQGRTQPNPVVGAVIVKNGRIIGKGYHIKAGTPHAEVHALRQAGAAAQGATIYVTLEPCSHHGRTPPCTDAIIQAGIARVVIATVDPNPRVAGQGIQKLRAHGIDVTMGILADEAITLNQPFFTWVTKGRPWVLAKWAMTLDGKIATSTGSSRWITGSAARRQVHIWRNQLDAVMVGIGTALADDPELTVRPDEHPGLVNRDGRQPDRIILDSHARLPVTAKVLAPTGKVWVAVTTLAPPERVAALRQAGAQLIITEPDEQGHVRVSEVLQALAQAGITSILAEGGSAVLGTLFTEQLVDKVAAFVAPKITGGQGAPTPVAGPGVAEMAHAWQLAKTSMYVVGDDWLMEGTLQEVRPCLPES
ncbi:diaminohydroxyphosphoribosylaminopyrimidine deaminase [Heliophilum fasciatum]|uniref:Riboflavin biosynthesis protein RibD n=2 Tax=Heliophilum fasciatum TaxID=35700 RepID=A0A4R2SAC5_9FIRM|nr:diaminohydroxyphosphoribosylaminopyrimidine deaminase [Heliophilum fasciatum]